MKATLRCAVGEIPAGAVVEIVALAIYGDARTLIAHDGRLARVSNDAVLDVHN